MLTTLTHIPISQTFKPSYAHTPHSHRLSCSCPHAHLSLVREAAGSVSHLAIPGPLLPTQWPGWEAHLHVLQGQVLPAASSVNRKQRPFTRHQAEDAHDGLHGGIDAETYVVAAGGERGVRGVQSRTHGADPPL